MNTYTIGSFINWCDDVKITPANESGLKKHYEEMYKGCEIFYYDDFCTKESAKKIQSRVHKEIDLVKKNEAKIIPAMYKQLNITDQKYKDKNTFDFVAVYNHEDTSKDAYIEMFTKYDQMYLSDVRDGKFASIEYSD